MSDVVPRRSTVATTEELRALPSAATAVADSDAELDHTEVASRGGRDHVPKFLEKYVSLFVVVVLTQFLSLSLSPSLSLSMHLSKFGDMVRDTTCGRYRQLRTATVEGTDHCAHPLCTTMHRSHVRRIHNNAQSPIVKVRLEPKWPRRPPSTPTTTEMPGGGEVASPLREVHYLVPPPCILSSCFAKRGRASCCSTPSSRRGRLQTRLPSGRVQGPTPG